MTQSPMGTIFSSLETRMQQRADTLTFKQQFNRWEISRRKLMWIVFCVHECTQSLDGSTFKTALCAGRYAEPNSPFWHSKLEPHTECLESKSSGDHGMCTMHIHEILWVRVWHVNGTVGHPTRIVRFAISASELNQSRQFQFHTILTCHCPLWTLAHTLSHPGKLHWSNQWNRMHFWFFGAAFRRLNQEFEMKWKFSFRNHDPVKWAMTVKTVHGCMGTIGKCSLRAKCNHRYHIITNAANNSKYHYFTKTWSTMVGCAVNYPKDPFTIHNSFSAYKAQLFRG